MSDSFRATALELGLAGSVKFTGFYADLYEALRSADIFALPSEHEGVPLSILEAMSQGLPIVASRVGGIPETVQEGKSGLLFEVGNTLQLFLCLQALIVDRELRQRMACASRARFKSSFTVDLMLQRHTDLWQSIWEEKATACRRLL